MSPHAGEPPAHGTRSRNTDPEPIATLERRTCAPAHAGARGQRVSAVALGNRARQFFTWTVLAASRARAGADGLRHLAAHLGREIARSAGALLFGAGNTRHLVGAREPSTPTRAAVADRVGAAGEGCRLTRDA